MSVCACAEVGCQATIGKEKSREGEAGTGLGCIVIGGRERGLLRFPSLLVYLSSLHLCLLKLS